MRSLSLDGFFLSFALVGIGVACGVTACTDCGDARRLEPAGPNLVIVMVDTLRADHLGAFGYPRPTSPVIDEFAARGVVFEKAFAQASWTVPSVSGLLTGQYPGNVDVLGDSSGRVATLAAWLTGHGFQTAAIVANPLMRPETGFANGFETFDFREWAAGDDLVESSLQWLHGSVQGYIRNNEGNAGTLQGSGNYLPPGQHPDASKPVLS
jgi:arylsulfatase A-like enzyme